MAGLFLLLSTGVAHANNMDVIINEDITAALGIEIQNGSFEVTTNTLTFGRADLEYFSGGSLAAGHFVVTAIPWTQEMELHDLQSGLKFRIDNLHIGEAQGMLHLLNADIVATTNTISADLFTNIESIVVGEFFAASPWRYVPVPAPLGDVPFCTTNYGPEIDVRLTSLNALQQVARSNGLVALSMSTKLVNVGTHDVPWFWAIDPPGPIQPVTGQHPYATFNFYQLKNGSFRQIGKSDVKHAFYSTNIDCDCPGAQVIFTQCADVYSVMNNANQFYFAPRSEVHAFSGQWDSLGSHFDVTAAEPTPDNFRSHSGETNDFAHRLTVQESMLADTNATYVVEAWYLVQGDTNEYSSMGHRLVTPVFTNGVWTFITNTTLTNGPALDAYVPRHQSAETASHRVVETGEGSIHVAVKVTPLGNGNYRYGYAVMNLNFDRQLQAFSIPISPGVTWTNHSFADTDTNSLNDWIFSVSDGRVSWTMGETNGLSWGSLYSFNMEADAPPTPSRSLLASLYPGATNEFEVSVLAPGIKISALAIDQDARINWPSISGAVYEVEFNDTVSGVGWTSLGLSITASTPSVLIIDTNSPSERLFYRLKLLSAP